MSITIVATMFPVDGQRAEVIAALEEAIESVHANDEGCELYALQEGHHRLVMIEKWAHPGGDPGALSEPALQSLTAHLEGKLVSPMDVQLLTPHPAGTAEQGTL